MKLKNHPYADLFPMMSSQELQALATDIEANGLQHPIILYQDAVLDGRNRLLACEMAKVEPTFRDHEGDEASALAMVISLNVQRRDLTAAQRAIVASRAMEQMPERRGRPEKGAKNMDGQSTLSRQTVAQTFKVGEKAVQQAKALISEAPDLASQVEVCSMSLAAAYEELQGRRKQAEQKRKDLQRVSRYSDAISSGEMTLEQALQLAVEDDREEREQIRHDAEARQLWLERLASFIVWVNEGITPRTDEHLAWYTEPGAQGTETGITADQLEDAIAQLGRVRDITFGGKHDAGKQRKSNGSRRS